MAESYSFPKQTIKVIESLKKTFGVDSNAEVISRALSLAQIVAESADDANSVVVVGKDKPVKLTLSD